VGGIGFKDLHSFNVALLAKQGWKLSHISNSLSYCMMKANFFPSCHFLHAKLRSNPSFLWCNVLGARDIVREGSSWSVGNGGSIRIWKDNWLLFTPPKHHSTKIQMVSDLIDRERNRWNIQRIEGVF
jgi:hypothetical protein